MSKQDRQGPRTPADLERRYGFEKRFAEVTGIATDARNEAEEAKRVATSISENEEGLSIRVKALDDEMVTVKSELEMKVSTDKDGNVTSKMHIGADTLTIDTDNFVLAENGTFAANRGLISGWTVDEFGIHQTNGVHGTFTITYSTTGTDIKTEIYTGYLFYCLQPNGIYRYIFAEDFFFPFDPTAPFPQPVLWLWCGDMFGNYTITAQSGAVTT